MCRVQRNAGDEAGGPELNDEEKSSGEGSRSKSQGGSAKLPLFQQWRGAARGVSDYHRPEEHGAFREGGGGIGRPDCTEKNVRAEDKKHPQCRVGPTSSGWALALRA